MLVVPLRRSRQADVARLRHARRRRLLDARRQSTTAASGSRPAAPPNYDLLYPLLDLVTTLDPHFSIAYRFGAIFLAEAVPERSGPSRPGDCAAAARDRADRPTGSTCTTSASSITGGCATTRRRRDWFERAAQMPGAPAWLKPLAATTLAAGGDRRTSRRLWTADAAVPPTPTGCAATPSSG